MAELVVFQLTKEEHLADIARTGIVEDRIYLTREGAQLRVAQTIKLLGYQPAEPEWRYDPDKGEWGMHVSGIYWRIKVRPVISTNADDIQNAPVDRMGADRMPSGSAQNGRSFSYSLRNTGAALLFLLVTCLLAIGAVTLCARIGEIACRFAGYC